ncbi:M56 family metallopeptidase [Adhaeribacter pallidiroseus]|uniref:Peptidase M56 domain-containing protein n=1 Tax=Adhaeribacter pallidiroseus TaxID=2072847 RepID=A0A369QTR5_9BACT|nr:M56 family metallopeptidase [Adhaeribacter pallidiroseus]RDC65548.1 hypothetical protein AHMF7616_04178 [Adhaeribacter pallidiroseus]
MMELLLKASFAVGTAFIFYKLLLQQESFFAANRFFLVGSLVLAFVLPFVSLPELVRHQGYLTTIWQQPERPANQRETATESQLATIRDNKLAAHKQVAPVPQRLTKNLKKPTKPAELAPEPATMSWLTWLIRLYLFGVVVFTLSLLFQVGTILFKIFTNPDKITDGAITIVNTPDRQAPCSFFRYIFIYPNDYDFATYEQIIAHEKIHARLGHSFDLLLAELAVIMLWFNPFSWFLKREIEKNNEYQTDALLLEQEPVSPRQYQLNLLQIATPNKPLSITTNYNQSLLKQRIKMMNAKKSTPHGYWKYSFLVPFIFGTLLLLNKPATSQELPASDILFASLPAKSSDIVPEKVVSEKERVLVQVAAAASRKNQRVSSNIRDNNVDMTTGYWYSHQEKGEYCLEFKGSQTASHWNMTRCFDKKTFQKTGKEMYVATKEPGTLQLNGALEAEVSQGKYTFTENPDFKKYLAANTITSPDKNFLFHLFFGEVNRQYVDFLKKQYGEVPGERLLEVAIHGISMPDYQKFLALFEKYNHQKPSMQEVIEAKIHDIDEAYVQELEAAGFKELSLKKIMEARIHDVNGSYVESLKNAGLSHLSLDKVIEAKIHDINPATVKELRALGFGALNLDKMMELNIHEVNAAYIKDLQAAGLKNLTLDQILEARIHDLNPTSIKEIRALGFNDLSFREMMDAQIHEVDAAFVADLKKAGLQNISLEKAVEAKIHDIDGNFIKQAKQKGYSFTTVDKYISLKIHGMAIESLKED